MKEINFSDLILKNNSSLGYRTKHDSCLFKGMYVINPVKIACGG
ncbi:hypothetical protein BH23THE1_BH23THE1_31630 [soil metagenome]